MREGIEKGDWISVEDGTPCFGEEVMVRLETGKTSKAVYAWTNENWHEHFFSTVEMVYAPVADWRPIAR